MSLTLINAECKNEGDLYVFSSLTNVNINDDNDKNLVMAQ